MKYWPPSPTAPFERRRPRRRRMSAALASFLAMASILAIAATSAFAAPPTATTEAATPVGAETATLRGSVNPNGVSSTYYFEWGLTTAYGKKSGIELGIGEGTAPVKASSSIGSLTQKTTYHFRIVAKNAAGTSFGEDKTFTTLQDWTLQETPNIETSFTTRLNDVSCLSGGECFAVGDVGSGEATLPLAERWNGSAWSQQSTPFIEGTGHSLYSVSCTATNACMAVGHRFGKALAERWDGTKWQLLTVPSTVSPYLTGVSCVSATECIAVGSTLASGKAARWNGTEWLAIAPPPTGSSDLSCVSASFCMSVGFGSPESSTWNGSVWTKQKTLGVIGAFKAVSCTASNACTAVGAQAGVGVTPPLAARWNGSEWSIQETPYPATAKKIFLEGVACTSATVCTATGWSGDSLETAVSTFAERWNGTSWKMQQSPNSGTDLINRLSAVSCISLTVCEAVGLHKPEQGGSSKTRALAERSI